MTDGAISTGREPEAILSPSEPVPDRVPRAALDYYPTPAWCVEAIRPHLPNAGIVLDPACGQGELLHAFREGSILLQGIDLDAGRVAAARAAFPSNGAFDVGDALACTWPGFDLVICNPPFSHGLEFLERALSLAAPRATVAFLLRLTFLESRERRSFHLAHPSDVYVLSERPKFRPGRDGKMATDSVTCAWFVFGPGRGGRWSIL